MLEELPLEIFEMIVCFLFLDELSNLCLVSKDLFEKMRLIKYNKPIFIMEKKNVNSKLVLKEEEQDCLKQSYNLDLGEIIDLSQYKLDTSKFSWLNLFEINDIPTCSFKVITDNDKPFNKLLPINHLQINMDSNFDDNVFDYIGHLDLSNNDNKIPINQIYDFNNIKLLTIHRINMDTLTHVVEKCKNTETIIIVNSKDLNYDELNKLENLKSLRFVNCKSDNEYYFDNIDKLSFAYSDDVKLSSILTLSNLKELSFDCMHYNELVVFNFHLLTQLVYLKLSSIVLNIKSEYITYPINLSSLKGIEGLKKLDLSSIEAKFDDISMLNNLEELNMNNLSSLLSINFLGTLNKLKSLSIVSCKVEDASILSKLTNLETLNISNNKILDINFLKKLTNLKELNISNNHRNNNKLCIRDSCIKKLSKLEILYANNICSNFNLSILKSIKHLSLLDSIIYNNGFVSESLLSFIVNINFTEVLSKDLPNLKTITVIGLEDINKLELLDKVETIIIRKTKIQTFDKIKCSDSLKMIDVSYTNITLTEQIKELYRKDDVKIYYFNEETGLKEFI